MEIKARPWEIHFIVWNSLRVWDHKSTAKARLARLASRGVPFQFHKGKEYSERFTVLRDSKLSVDSLVSIAEFLHCSCSPWVSLSVLQAQNYKRPPSKKGPQSFLKPQAESYEGSKLQRAMFLLFARLLARGWMDVSRAAIGTIPPVLNLKGVHRTIANKRWLRKLSWNFQEADLESDNYVFSHLLYEWLSGRRQYNNKAIKQLLQPDYTWFLEGSAICHLVRLKALHCIPMRREAQSSRQDLALLPLLQPNVTAGECDILPGLSMSRTTPIVIQVGHRRFPDSILHACDRFASSQSISIRWSQLELIFNCASWSLNCSCTKVHCRISLHQWKKRLALRFARMHNIILAGLRQVNTRIAFNVMSRVQCKAHRDAQSVYTQNK